MPQKFKNKITGQLHACLHVSFQWVQQAEGAGPGRGPGGGGGAGGFPGGVSLITGSDQKRYLNQSRVNPTGLKSIYIFNVTALIPQGKK
jgi:hypothetical protein